MSNKYPGNPRIANHPYWSENPGNPFANRKTRRTQASIERHRASSIDKSHAKQIKHAKIRDAKLRANKN